MKTTSLAIIAVVATALSASAQTVSSPIVPAGFSPVNGLAGPQAANGTTFSLTVPRFDGSLGILQSVSYTLDTWSYGSGTLLNAANLDPSQFTYSWTFGTLIQPNTLDVPGTGVVNLPISPLLSEATVVLAGVNQPFTTGVKNWSTPSAAAPNTGAYTGPGTVTFIFDPFVDAGVSGFQGGSLQPSVFAAARINVTYTYSDIPEASTYAAGAILLAGAGLVARRRLAAK